MANKAPTIQQLVDIIAEYNKARELELRATAKVAALPANYRNELLEALYDCALGAAQQLRPAVALDLSPPK